MDKIIEIQTVEVGKNDWLAALDTVIEKWTPDKACGFFYVLEGNTPQSFENVYGKVGEPGYKFCFVGAVMASMPSRACCEEWEIREAMAQALERVFPELGPYRDVADWHNAGFDTGLHYVDSSVHGQRIEVLEYLRSAIADGRAVYVNNRGDGR